MCVSVCVMEGEGGRGEKCGGGGEEEEEGGEEMVMGWHGGGGRELCV